MKQGDWSRYGQELDALQKVLSRMAEPVVPTVKKKK
jgi:hypothetical protein